MRFSKRASLSLSINAIVVLILAITMLGLGLGFVRNMFTQGEDSLTTIFDTTKLSNPATAGDPIKAPASITGKASEVIRVEFSIYNTDSTAWSKVTPKLAKNDNGNNYCLRSDDIENIEFKLTAAGAEVNPSTAVGWVALLKIPATVSTDHVFLCPIVFDDVTKGTVGTAQMSVRIIS